MRIWRDVRGFSLSELLTAFAVIAFVLAAVMTVQEASFRAFLIGSNKSAMQQNARVALERMGREVRESTGALTAATATTITFAHPDDGVVTYTLMNNTLERNVDPDGPLGPQPLATAVFIAGVQELDFMYFDGAGTALPPPVAAVNVRRIDIRIRTRAEDPNVRAGAAEDSRTVVSTTVRLRNVL
jgi:type II secretory pathway pseudopilin PulG